MEKPNTKELWGVSFRVVPDGLAEDEVVSFVNKIMEKGRSPNEDQERQDSLRILAEQTVVEADRLAGEIKQQARQDSEDEANRTRLAAEEQAKAELDRMVKQAERDVAAESRTTIANSEKQAQDILNKARMESRNIIQTAKDRTDAIENEAKLEAEYVVRRLTMKFVEEVRAVVTEASNSILPSLDTQIGETKNQEALSQGSEIKPSTTSSSRKRV